MKRITKSQPKKALARKSAKAKTPSTERGQNASTENVPSEKAMTRQTTGQERKKFLLALPPAGAGRTVTSPTPLDE